MPTCTVTDSSELSARDRLMIIVLVLIAHVFLLWYWSAFSQHTNKPIHLNHHMTVSLDISGTPLTRAVQPESVSSELIKPKPVKSKRLQPVTPIKAHAAVPDALAEPAASVGSSALTTVAHSGSAQPVNTRDALPDSEPAYDAAYLNNPKPVYPMVAKRMGWQGRVVLDVEVLASGLPGEVKLHRSSGHDVLDSAALKSVQKWHFVPARQNGESLTRRFLIPIPFTLSED